MDRLAKMWPCDSWTAVEEAISPFMEPQNGWTRFAAKSYNLHLHDSDLRNALQEFIDEEGARLGIPCSEVNTGKPTQPISWRPRECWDRCFHLDEVLNDSDRASWRKALLKAPASI